MGKYIKHFETVAEYNEARENEYIEPWVSYTEELGGINYNKTEYEKLLEMPLTFEITSDGVIKWKTSNSGLTKTIEYSKDSGTTWTSITSTTGGTDISVVSGDTVQFRGDNAVYTTSEDYYNTFSGTTASFNVKGNIMSLIDSDGFVNANSLTSSYTFSCLFINCTGLTDASKLILPATTLTSSCYSNMFSGCISLTTAPKLPATTLVSNCYQSMFAGCTALTTAPALPATTLATTCYSYMFTNCSSLTTAPELPATTLASNCYQYMFYNCTSLTTAPELPATTLAIYCYQNMFQSCTALTTAPALPATTLASSCYYGMFRGCTALITAPELPTTTLKNNCYNSMFSGCTSLNYIKCLATDISASNCTNNWVNGVASSGTFVKNASMTSWTSGNNGIPTNWSVQDAS